MLSSVLSMMVFSILLFVYLKEEIGLTWKRDTVSWRLLVPYLVFLATTIVGLNVSQYMIVIFLLLNLKEIKKIGETIFLIFNKPNIVNV